MNTRLRTYLETLFTLPAGTDLSTMLVKYLREQGSGDVNGRFQALIAAA